jgi:D-alanyl-D-alanine carboxypeptidase/D-alanyl-D-alanine-endopeptidase (penicillin-binding protein 4)
LLTGVLEAAASPDHPRLRGLFAGLPVAAYSGTLAKRFGGPAASSGAGEVRAKTGSLSGVSALAGVVVADNGRQLAFAAVANGFPGNGGEAVASSLDRIAAALAGCGCA